KTEQLRHEAVWILYFARIPLLGSRPQRSEGSNPKVETNVYYSFYKEDIKYNRDPLEVSYAMWSRIQKKIQLTHKTHVIAFVNGEVYPQEVIWRVG
ncbi:MAG: hypothetical protein HWD92_09335, partial [Flavobacteriia bacterium]|nr:hypothetical protein [Flavobacteriia bacterium]